GRLRYLPLTRRRQIVFIGLGTALAIWMLGATVASGYLALDRLAAQREIEGQRLEYVSLLSDIGAYHQEFARIVDGLEGNQSLLLSRLADTAGTEDEGFGIDQIQDQLNDTRVDKARMLIVRQGLRSRLESFEEDLQQLAARDADRRERLSATLETLEQTRAEGAEVAAARAVLDEELSRVESDRERLAGEKAELELRLAAAQEELEAARQHNEVLARQSRAFHAEVESLYGEVGAAPEREEQLQTKIVTLQSDLEAARSWTETLQAQRDFHESRADKMEARLNEVSDVQSAVVARLAKRTMAGIDMIERIVAMTGLNVNELIASMDLEGLALAQGGPYFDIAGDYLITDDPHLELQSSVFVLNQQMDRWEALQEVIRSIPLASPLDHYRVSSGYGERTDPVNGRKAMHYGIDLKAPPKTPIMATAPGTVVFAGWRGEYGRVVEIDHGNGIRTRYAHLRKILVKKGQEVAHRQEIALLGNSGRSTGAHVHYEILVDGQPKDPARFVMAGRNAFKD
ncbi:MAG: peptidoglycan DD-metalloendopeptidase family protein, partial [Kiloniellales bacterium]|nr:peptidoglycan DD-metalloendopeptidase family protein [Kiloniellales bacterium]